MKGLGWAGQKLGQFGDSLRVSSQFLIKAKNIGTDLEHFCFETKSCTLYYLIDNYLS